MATVEVGMVTWKAIRSHCPARDLDTQCSIELTFRKEWLHLNILGTDNTTIRWNYLPPMYFLNYSNDWWGCCIPPLSEVLCVTPRRGHPNGFLSRDSQSGVPKLSRVGVLGLWTTITSRPDLWSGRGLNQSCSPRRELFNAMSHSRNARRERVDSRLLVVGSQTANLTPGPSFAHNLGCRCPNDQCEAIFDIYASRPFQWHQEHPNARCFGPCCRTLNIRESRRTPSPQLWECWASPPHLAKVGLRHILMCLTSSMCLLQIVTSMPISPPCFIRNLWGN
jgi:hypothetical protein